MLSEINHLITLFNFKDPRTYRLAAFILGIGSLCLACVLWYLTDHQHQVQIQRQTSQTATAVQSHLKETLDQDIQLLQGLAKRWEFQGKPSKKDWLADAHYIVQENKSFLAIEWVDPSFHVRWIAPLAGNEKALNLNLAFEAKRKRALQAARDKKSVTISKSIDLVQGGKGFLVYVPIFVQSTFQGFILGVFKIDRLLSPIMAQPSFHNFNLNLTENEKVIFLTHYLEYQYHHAYAQKQPFHFKDIHWEIAFWPKAYFVKNLHSYLPNILLLSGLFISIILFSITYLLGLLKANTLKIKQKSDELELISQGTKLIAQARHFNDAIQSCITFVALKIHAQLGHAYLLDESNHQQLISSDLWYIEKGIDVTDFCKVTRETTFQSGVGLPGRIWASQKPDWIANIQLDPNFPRVKKCTNLPFKGAIGFPIIVNQQVVAVLEFFHVQVIQYNKNLLRILTILGEHIGKLWEKRRAENLLKLSEQKNRTIIESALDPIIIINTHGIIQECNSATGKVFKYEISDLIGKNVSCLMQQPEKKEHDQYIQRYLKTGQSKIIGKGREVIGVNSQNQILYLYLTIHELMIAHELYFIGILRDISENVKIKKQLTKLAHYDYLTDLPNRPHFDEALQKILDRAERQHNLCALLYLDLDCFKAVNDTLGHAIGDTLLKVASQRMQKYLRTYDFIARLGGDEFAIIIQDLTTQQDACLIADKLIDSFKQPFQIESHTISVGLSIGIAYYPKTAKQARALVRTADQALYAAKKNGRNQYQIYQDDTTHKSN